MTEYGRQIGLSNVQNVPLATSLKKPKDYARGLDDYEHVRVGEPHEALQHNELLPYCIRLADLAQDSGYTTTIPSDIPVHLYKAVLKFRATLDCYFAIVKEPVFSREELYIRCLREGPTFTEYLKKARSTSLRHIASETETSIETEFLVENYTGYDSIIHERSMIHWDDRSEIDDIKHSFMEVKEIDDLEFTTLVDDYLDHIGIGLEDFICEEFDLLAWMQPTSMLDPATGKTSQMRSFWRQDINLNEPYLGKRTVTLTFPGSTRDALVGTPSTVARVKMLNRLARIVSEKSPHSANASGSRASDRYLRVLTRKWFMHLDFKKYGLMFPRALTNIMIRRICVRAEIDPDPLIIDSFAVMIDGETYQTERGTALGWLDPINALCVNAILFGLQAQLAIKCDWIGFNDDFELGFWDTGDMPNTLNAYREILFCEFDHWDILLSSDKIYGSRASVFLENYSYFDKYYKLDMKKRQLAANTFASSLVAPEPWVAKVLFAQGWRTVENDYIRERCINTCPIEFNHNEIFAAVEFGGWYDETHPVLSQAMKDTPPEFLELGAHLMDVDIPKYTSRVKKVSPPEVITESANEKAHFANSAAMYRDTIADPGKPEDINPEAPSARQYVELLLENYCGKSEKFVQTALSYVAQRQPWDRAAPP